MSPELPQYTRGTTKGNQEHRNNDYSEDVLIILAIIAIDAALLQVKFLNERKSPFETDFATMVAFLVALQAYCFALVAKKKLVEAYKAYAEIIKYYVHLCGFLSNVLLLMMLVPILGRIFLGIWVCCFIIVTYWLHAKINAPPANARNGDNLNRVPNRSTNAEANGDGISEAPNASTDEESNRSGNAEANGDVRRLRTLEIAFD